MEHLYKVTTPQVSDGFPEAWARFTARLAEGNVPSTYERHLAEAFYCIGKTAGLEEAIAIQMSTKGAA